MSEEYEDLYTTDEWRRYAQDQIDHTLPKIKDSAAFLSIGGVGDNPNVRMATELGFALLLGKPLIFVAEPGQVIPQGLRRAADKIIFGEIQHPKTMAKLKAAFAEVAPEQEK